MKFNLPEKDWKSTLPVAEAKDAKSTYGIKETSPTPTTATKANKPGYETITIGSTTAATAPKTPAASTTTTAAKTPAASVRRKLVLNY